jgi:CSLREA domain-containing protein
MFTPNFSYLTRKSRVLIAILYLFGILFVAQPARAATLTVNSTADNVTAGDGNCTLREAITNANLAGGGDSTSGDCVAGSAGADTITFDATLSGATIRLGSTLTLASDITIDGSSLASSVILNGDANSSNTADAGDVRIFYIADGDPVNPPGPAVTLRSLTLTRGLGVGAPSSAGAIYSDGTLNVYNSTFTNNSAEGAGAIVVYTGSATIVNSTFSGNSATNGTAGYGGAIYTRATLNVYNSTFSGNSAGVQGDAIAVRSSGTLNYANTIIANSSGNSSCYILPGGTISTNTNNLVENNSVTNSCAPTFTTGSNLAALASNGGPTQTFALQAGSSAINNGDNATCANASVNNRDQRGVPRPMGAQCDIGSYEYFVPTSLAPSSGGGDGPGGVGITNGSTNLVLWLRADKGVYSDAGCATVATDTSNVACWRDQSGYARSYTQSTGGSQPNYYTIGRNNLPVLRFNGSSDYLANPGSAGAVLAAGDDTFSYFASWMSNTAADFQVIFEQNNDTLVAGRRAALLASPTSLYGFNGELNDFHDAAPFTTGQFEVSSIVLNGAASNNVLVYGQGTQYPGTINITTQNVGTTGGSAVGYKITSASEFFDGDVPEVIVFSDALNDVDRILVQNYLSAKYAVPLAANDIYDGDGNTSGNGDFDQDMAGIGYDGTNFHTQSHSAGIIVVNRTFLQNSGDWLTFGHLTPANSNVSTYLPTTGVWTNAPAPQRWARHWYFDRTDAGTAGGTVDIIFDFSEGGMDNQPSLRPTGPISNYRLLGRAGTGDTFTDYGGATAIVGDQVQFLGVDVTLLGSNFTLGTLDAGGSPTAVTVKNVEVGNHFSLILALGGLAFGVIVLFIGKRWLSQSRKA